MTFSETASAMRRLADGIDKVIRELHRDPQTGKDVPMLDGDFAVGGACLLVYLRDLFTMANKEQFDRAEVLVLLETISRDYEIFPCGVAEVMWNADEETLEAR